MAAPTPVVLSTVIPRGVKLKDGFPIRVGLSVAPTIELWMKTVTPAEIDGGDMVDQTTQFNTTYVTGAAQVLLKYGQAVMKCAYHPGIFAAAINVVNIQGVITFFFPDVSTVSFYAYVQKMSPAEVSRGQQPEMNVTINITNWDPVNNVEAGPAVTSTSGT